MKLTARRETTVRDVDPGETLVNAEGRWVIDEIRLKRDGVELMCFTEGSDSSRRKSLEIKNDETFTVEAGYDEGLELLSMLNKLLLGKPPVAGPWHGFDKDAGTLMLMLGTKLSGEGDTATAGRIWSILLEA